MNKIYKVIWNATSGVWIAVSELAKGKTKSSITLARHRINSPKTTVFRQFQQTTLVIAIGVFSPMAWASANCLSGPGVNGTTTTDGVNNIGMECTSFSNGGMVFSANQDGNGPNEGIILRTKTDGAGTSGSFLNLFNGAGNGPTKVDIRIGDSRAISGGSTFRVFTDQTSIGNATTLASATSSQAIGAGATVTSTGTNGTALGTSAKVEANNGSALGNTATVSAADGAAIGSSATVAAGATNGIAIGKSANTSLANAVALGSGATTATNAATVSSATVGNLTYSGFSGTVAGTGNQVSVGAVGAERQIKNVAAGAISSSSTDSINGSQLYSVANTLAVRSDTQDQNLATALGGGANYNPTTGAWAAPSYVITKTDGTSYASANNVGQAIQNLNTEVIKPLTITGTTGTTSNTLGSTVAIIGDAKNITTEVTSNQLKVKISDTPNFTSITTGNSTLNNNGLTITGGPSVLSTGIDASSQKITNVADGALTTGSKEAVNGGQLKATNDQVATNTANISQNTSDINTINTNISTLQGGFTLNSNGADGGAIKAGDTVDIGTASGESNLTVTKTGNTIDFALNKNLNVDSVTTGNSTLDNNGLTIAGGPSVLSSGINAGNQKITNVKDGTIATGSHDAVNGSQLNDTNVTVGNHTNSINNIYSQLGDLNKGFNLATNGSDSGAVKASDTVDIGVADVTDTNLKASKSGHNITFELNKTLDLTSVKTGSSTLDNNGLTITGGPSVLNTGIDAASQKITNVADGALTAGSKDAVNGGQLKATNDQVSANTTNISKNTSDINTINSNISTLQGGFNLNSNGAGSGAIKAGDTVDIGTASGESNLTVTKTGNTIDFALNKNLNVDSVTLGNSQLDSNGLKITGGPSVLANGIDAGSKVVTNVADGALTTTSKDAVNGSQLNTTNQNVTANSNSITNLQNQTWKLQANGDTASAVKSSDTVQFVDGNNIKVSHSGNNITIATTATPTFNSVTVNNAPVTGTDATNKAYVDSLKTHFFSVKNSNSAAANFNNDGATGTDSLAAGVGASATNSNATAIGKSAVANGANSTALGSNALSKYDNSIAMGNGAQAKSNNVVSLGNGAGVTANDAGSAGTATTTTNEAYSVYIGNSAGQNSKGNLNTIVGGNGTGVNLTGSANTVLGTQAGRSYTGDENVMLGRFAGFRPGSPGTGNNNVMLGSASLASAGNNSLALGNLSTSLGDSNTVLGDEAYANGKSNISIGTKSQVTGTRSISIGAGNVVSGNSSGAIGDPTTVSGNGTYSYGNNNGTIDANESGVFGNNNTLTTGIGLNGVRVIGNNNTISANNAMVLGNSITVDTPANDAVALGNHTKVTQVEGVALGTNSVADIGKGVAGFDPTTNTASTIVDSTWVSTSGGVSVGDSSKGITRQINNLAAGRLDTDAVNVRQLKAVKTDVVQGDNIEVTKSTDPVDGHSIYTVATAKAVNFDKTTVGSVVTDSATGKISGLAAGDLTNTSTDAVNGSQLKATNDQVNKNTGDITNLQNNLNNGSVGLVQQTGGSPGKGEITVAKDTGGTVINMQGTDGNRKIINVADGTVALNSKEVVNGGQLFGVSDSIKNIIGGNTTVNADGSLTTQNIGGTGQNTINGAITELGNNITTLNGGFNLQTNGQNKSAIKAGDLIDIGVLDITDKNLTAVKQGNNVAFALSQDLNLNSVTMGNTTINNNGLTIVGGPSVTMNGIDAGNKTITNVGTAVNNSDAVNKGQMDQAISNVNKEIENLSGHAVQYDKNKDGTVNKGSVTLGDPSTGATGLHNVADGNVTQNSKDAVNGGQLWTVQQQVNKNSGDISNIQNSINNGSVGLVQQVGGSPGKGDITVAAHTGGIVVNMKGTDGDRQVTGVANGAVNEKSKDAINGSQLNTTNQAIVSYLGSGAGYDNITGSFTGPTYNVDGKDYKDVGSAIGALNATDQALNSKIDNISNNLENAFQTTNKRINDVEKKANAGVAAAMALEAAPYTPGKYTYAAGAAYHGGENAVGVTLRKTADNGRWSITGGIAAASQGDPSVRIGISGVID
jgi:autotransporter adhesin